MKKLLTIIVTILSLTQFLNGSITRTLYKYDFSAVVAEDFNKSSDLSKGFVFEFSLKEKPIKHAVLIDMPNSFKLSVENALSTYYSAPDNNLAIVAQIHLEQLDKQFVQAGNKCEKMRIELPVNAIKGNIKDARIALVYDGVKFYFTLNGKEFDKNYPFGSLKRPTNVNFTNYKQMLSNFKFSTETSKITRQKISEKSDAEIQYYTPAGFNCFAGDVALFYHNKTFYLLYLADRNHHAMRWGGGAHEFNLLTSKDLINWQDHGSVIEVDEPWKSVGTGTMFFHKGKYYISFGFHTSRVIDYNHTVSSKYTEIFKEQSRPIARKEFAPLYPSGTNIAVSNDGINFKWTEKFYNISENPSIFQTSKGLKMFSGYGGCGTWAIADIEGNWKKESSNFPVAGMKTLMRNTTECLCYFEHNNWRYFIMGTNGFWGAKGDDKWIDMASKGFDIYDGLCVPMVTNYKDNRLIIGGWFWHGWGSAIVLRELFAYPDGVLGMKWVKELQPPEKVVVQTCKQNDGFAEMLIAPEQSYSARMTITPNTIGKFKLRFQQTNAPKHDVDFTIDFGNATAQIHDSSKNILPMSRIVKNTTKRVGWALNNCPNDVHFFSRDFCIENLRNIDKPFELRFILRRSKKLNSNIIDIEIAHSRTMITNRIGAKFDRIKIEYPNGDVKNITLFEYKNEEKF